MSAPLSFAFCMKILGLTLVGWLIMYIFVNRRQVDHERCLDFGTEWDRKKP